MSDAVGVGASPRPVKLGTGVTTLSPPTGSPELLAPKRKRSSGTSAVQRSMARARKKGWIAAIVERWNPHVRIRQDLFNVADILVVRDGEIVLVQVKNVQNRGEIESAQTKFEGATVTRAWLMAGGSIEVWAWRKRGDRGKRKLWTCRVDSAGFSHLASVTGEGPLEWAVGKEEDAN